MADIFDTLTVERTKDIFDDLEVPKASTEPVQGTQEPSHPETTSPDLRPSLVPAPSALEAAGRRIAGQAQFVREHPIPSILSPFGTAIGFAKAATGVQSQQEKIAEDAAFFRKMGNTEDKAMDRAVELNTAWTRGIPSKEGWKPLVAEPGEGVPSKVGKGVANAAVGLTDFMTSGAGILALMGGASFAAGGAAPEALAARRAMTSTFAADMAKEQPEQLVQLWDAIKKGDWTKASELGLNNLLAYLVQGEAVFHKTGFTKGYVKPDPAALGETVARIPTGTEGMETAIKVMEQSKAVPPMEPTLVPPPMAPRREEPTPTPPTVQAAQAMQAGVAERLEAGKAAPAAASEAASARAQGAVEAGRERVEAAPVEPAPKPPAPAPEAAPPASPEQLSKAQAIVDAYEAESKRRTEDARVMEKDIEGEGAGRNLTLDDALRLNELEKTPAPKEFTNEEIAAYVSAKKLLWDNSPQGRFSAAQKAAIEKAKQQPAAPEAQPEAPNAIQEREAAPLPVEVPPGDRGAVEQEVRQQTAAPEAATVPKAPGAKARDVVLRELPKPKAIDYQNRDKVPGEHYRAKPNSIVIQFRGLDTEPLKTGQPFELKFTGDLKKAGRDIMQAFRQARDQGLDFSYRETPVIATDAKGNAIYHFKVNPASG